MSIIVFRRNVDMNLQREMHRHRKAAFCDRLHWVQPISDFELDGYDTCDPVYLASVDQKGAYRGSLRLLPTTGLNMLAHTFPELMDGAPAPSDPGIYESSRICADDPIVFRELLVGAGEVCLSLGVKSIVSVFDRRVLILLKRCGTKLDVIGRPKSIGGVDCFAAEFPVPRSEAEMADARAAYGFDAATPVVRRWMEEIAKAA